MIEQLKKLGVHIPEILLPADGTDLSKWAVIACDQYTSQPDYWQNVSREVGSSPSTLRLIFPEIYLKDDDKEERIANINKTMEQYLDQGILESQGPCFILVERSTPHTPSRKGLVLALDLEQYDYRPGAQTLIRATEGTVLDRIPPRVKIRENALIELPHIMVLIDDPQKTVVESLYAAAADGKYKKLYDFELMQGGGHIKGWKVDDEESFSMVAQALSKLICSSSGSEDGDGSSASVMGAEDSTFISAKSVDNGCSSSGDGSKTASIHSCSDLLFAVGDGNHSLASAKAHWENVKAALLKSRSAQAVDPSASQQGHLPEQAESYIPEHPARYALVEIVNVHDEGIVFEPIHRVLFNIDASTIADLLKKYCTKQHLADFRLFDSKEDMEEAKKKLGNNGHVIPFILEGRYGIMIIENPVSNIEVGSLQSILDELISNNPDIEIDYIHGDNVVTALGSKPGAMGFYLPVMNKHDLFPTVKLDGVLPRKTFSMGEAEEKRYYLECRRIK